MPTSMTVLGLIAASILWFTVGYHTQAKYLLSNQSNMNESQFKLYGTSNSSDETWGGPHVEMLMTANGAELEFDCAQGRINSKIKTDKEGDFDVEGTFRREGGPVRSDEAGSGSPVRYVGKIVGDSMTLKIHFTDQTTEAFSLTRGKNGQLRKCR